MLSSNTVVLSVNCGEGYKHNDLPVILQTMDQGIGRGLDWYAEGPLNEEVYSKEFIIPVTVASLNAGVHNGTGGGKNEGYGTAFVLRTEIEIEEDQRHVGGIRLSRTRANAITYLYSEDTETHHSTSPCGEHVEE